MCVVANYQSAAPHADSVDIWDESAVDDVLRGPVYAVAVRRGGKLRRSCARRWRAGCDPRLPILTPAALRKGCPGPC